MKFIVVAFREIYGLFVDDGSYAVVILVWLLFAAIIMPHLLEQHWCAPVLCLGLLLILVENVVRSARELSRMRN